MKETEQKTGTEPAGAKPVRKKKAAARWAMMQHVGNSEDSAKEPLFRIVVDCAKSEKAAREAGESANITGRVLMVCIHADGVASQKTLTEINWKK